MLFSNAFLNPYEFIKALLFYSNSIPLHDYEFNTLTLASSSKTSCFSPSPLRDHTPFKSTFFKRLHSSNIRVNSKWEGLLCLQAALCTWDVHVSERAFRAAWALGSQRLLVHKEAFYLKTLFTSPFSLHSLTDQNSINKACSLLMLIPLYNSPSQRSGSERRGLCCFWTLCNQSSEWISPGPSRTHLPWRCCTAGSRQSGQQRRSPEHGLVQPA